MKILVVSGGTSSERRISLISAQQVIKALKKNSHQVKLYDLKQGISALKQEAAEVDLIFPMIHGEEGESGRLHSLLRKLKKPFVGHTFNDSELGWYKINLKKLCDKWDIPHAEWKVVKSPDEIKVFGFPCVLKSTNGGSSREVVILHSEKDLQTKETRHIFKLGVPLFVERFLEGIEVTIGILLGNVLPIIEIIPAKGEWFNYKNKYWGNVQEIPHAPSLPDQVKKDAANIALDLHKKLNLGPHPRIDFIVSNNKPHVLEINTIPGFTPSSLFPKAAQAAGISFNQLVESLVQDAYSSLV